MDPGLLELLRCPRTGGALHVVDGVPWPGFPSVEREVAVDGFLVSEDGQVAYPIRGGIPDLLPDSAMVRASVSG